MIKKKKLSPYTVLTKWLYDNKQFSPIPDDIIKDKSIGPQFLLYHFQSSPMITILNKLFNNLDIFQIDRLDSFKLMKTIILKTGFKPKFFSKSKQTSSKLYKCLKRSYPYLKKYEMVLLIDAIEDSDYKNQIYETFGLIKPKKKKTTKTHKAILKNSVADIFEPSMDIHKNDIKQLLSSEESIKTSSLSMDNTFIDGFDFE